MKIMKDLEKFTAIAIDGPSGAGKSSLAKRIAQKLDFVYLDTGALYRAIGLFVRENNISENNETEIINLINRANNKAIELKISFEYLNGEQVTLLNNRNVSADIRENIISKYASCVSKLPEIRAFLLDIQKDFAKNNDCVMDGRDVGTVILPNAQVKIFLTASAEIRTKRRFDELILKGERNIIYEQILSEIKERDERDINRDIMPLKPANDAIILDNSNLNEEETFKFALNIIKEKINYV